MLTKLPYWKNIWGGVRRPHTSLSRRPRYWYNYFILLSVFRFSLFVLVKLFLKSELKDHFRMFGIYNSKIIPVWYRIYYYNIYLILVVWSNSWWGNETNWFWGRRLRDAYAASRPAPLPVGRGRSVGWLVSRCATATAAAADAVTFVVAPRYLLPVPISRSRFGDYHYVLDVPITTHRLTLHTSFQFRFRDSQFLFESHLTLSRLVAVVSSVLIMSSIDCPLQ